jgi:phosphoribosylcarboxyaminoimidazole (NCAIR) mutase
MTATISNTFLQQKVNNSFINPPQTSSPLAAADNLLVTPLSIPTRCLLDLLALISQPKTTLLISIPITVIEIASSFSSSYSQLQMLNNHASAINENVSQFKEHEAVYQVEP